MRVLLRDIDRKPLGQIELASGATPACVSTEKGREVYLNWEGAHDDEGHLRRCLSCGCDTLYRHRRMPQVTGFVIVLALALGLGGILGLATGLPFLIAMVLVLLLDVAILVLSRETLECYRCRSSYRNLDIAQYHQRWNGDTARRITSGDVS
ncbi:MAG: hypothetical protein P8I91_04550 [Phycisphaerales bacterium]|nr:hypothetical protein [Phycisphaerales bacterium]